MRKVYEKSILLGIGIGMIITAIAGMIYSAGNQKELSKEEIISIAKSEYGLIEQVKILNNSIDSANASTDSAASNSSIADNSATESTLVKDSSDNAAEATNKQQQSDSSFSSTSVRNISIEIKYAYKANDVINILLERGVITNREDFTAVMHSYKASTKIRVGTFMFKKNDDLDYIVQTICKFK